MLKVRDQDRPLLVGLLAIPAALALAVLSNYLAPQKEAVDTGSNQNGWEIISWLLYWDANDTIAALTAVIALIGLMQWRHFRVTERAYIKMSHVTPDKGSAIFWGGKNWFDVEVQIKNFGRTPATVTDVLLTAVVLKKGEALPHPIPYVKVPDPTGEDNRMGAFLVADDKVYRTGGFEIGEEKRKLAEQPGSILLFYGYVDYIDQFGDRYRGGYGRQMIKEGSRLLLNFPDFPTVNYDRKRKRGEGVDWDT